jgi:hypothetical protein
LYQAHATLILNGHEHYYARCRPMNPAGQYDPQHGIPQITVGTGGEGLDTLATENGHYSNPNVVTAQDQAFGVMTERLLINGASGSVGSAAVQLAVVRGARVIGTASPANHSYLRSLGRARCLRRGPGRAGSRARARRRRRRA